MPQQLIGSVGNLMSDNELITTALGIKVPKNNNVVTCSLGLGNEKVANPHITYLDNEVLIEWIYKDHRFGISLDRNKPEQSSWYFVTKGDIMDSGLLPAELDVPLELQNNS